MNKLYLAALLLVITMALLVALKLRRRHLGYTYVRTPLLTANETEFYGRLRQALPWAQILPQTAMSALVQPNPLLRGKMRLQALYLILSKRLDFVICTDNLRVVCVIELDDRSHNADRDAKRDKILASAGIPTLRYESRASERPTPNTIASDVATLRSAHPSLH
jgi:very-short-patch-repair endonuclease